MTPRLVDYVYILATIALTVYGQVILKWRIGDFGAMPEEPLAQLRFLLRLLLDPAILSGFVAAFLASLTWMAALTRLELSFAYPFMSLNFAVVLLLSAWLLHEPLTLAKVAGVALIVAGTIVASHG